MSFTAYDGLLFRDKPASSALGLADIRVLYESELFPRGEPATAAEIDALGASIDEGGLPAAIDIEAWRPTDETTVEELYLPFAQRLRAATSMPIGYYNVLPAHHPGLKPESLDQDVVAAWRAAQTSEPAARLFPYMDMTCYSAYRWDGLRDWTKRNRMYAKTIRDAVPGLKLVPFVWFNFHDALGDERYRNTEIPRAEWRIMLEVIRQVCDGCILWGGYKSAWDDRAQWWLETQDWLARSSRKPSQKK